MKSLLSLSVRGGLGAVTDGFQAPSLCTLSAGIVLSWEGSPQMGRWSVCHGGSHAARSHVGELLCCSCLQHLGTGDVCTRVCMHVRTYICLDCMCVHAHTCMCAAVHTRIRVHVCIHAHTCICSRTHAYMHLHVHVCTHVHVCVCSDTHVHMCRHAVVCTHVRMCAHMHLGTHVYVCMCTAVYARLCAYVCVWCMIEGGLSAFGVSAGPGESREEP